jgi:hypothetical protein
VFINAKSSAVNSVSQFATMTVTLFAVFTILVPAAFVNKIVFVFIFLLIAAFPFASKGTAEIKSLSPVIVLTIFLYGYAVSFLGDCDRVLGNQLMLSVAVLFLIYAVIWYRIDFDKVIKTAGIALCGFTVGSVLTMVLAPQSVFGEYITNYFVEYGLGAYGVREFGDDRSVMFHFGTAPFLFLPYCLFLMAFLETRHTRDLVAGLFILIVIVASTSRALVLGCVVATGYLWVRRLRPRQQAIALCVLLATGVLATYGLITRTAIFSLTEAGNSIKVGHAVSFLENLTVPRILLGDGLASYYFSIGRNAYLSHTEITLFDMFRYFGFPLTILLYAALFFPSLSGVSPSDSAASRVLIIIYFLISLTNPVLFNSYGLLIVVWYWAKQLPLNLADAPNVTHRVAA